MYSMSSVDGLANNTVRNVVSSPVDSDVTWIFFLKKTNKKRDDTIYRNSSNTYTVFNCAAIYIMH